MTLPGILRFVAATRKRRKARVVLWVVVEYVLNGQRARRLGGATYIKVDVLKAGGRILREEVRIDTDTIHMFVAHQAGKECKGLTYKTHFVGSLYEASRRFTDR